MITISPVKGSKKFYDQATQFQKVMIKQDGNWVDSGEVRDAGAYTGERFPKTKQGIRFPWSYGSRKFKTGTLTDEQLQELVKDLKLINPKNGKLIETADPTNFSDPFFNHQELIYFLDEAEGNFQEDNIKDKLMIEAAKSNINVKVASEENPMTASIEKYVISDTTMDAKIVKKKNDKLRDCFKLFEALNYDKKKKLALAINLPINPTIVEPEILDDAILKFIDDNKVVGNTSSREIFISICKEDNETFNLKYFIGLARKKGLLRKNSKQGYLFMGNPVGKTLNDVESFFTNPANQEFQVKLESMLEDNDK